MKKMLLLFLISFLAKNSFAQERLDSLEEKAFQNNYQYSQLYKENSDMSYSSPRGELGAPSGYVINGKLTTTFMVFAPINLPIAFSINPDYTVRVRTDRSAGVRTPSFRFGGTFYTRLTDDVKKYKYAQLSFTHHSNGQDEEAILPDGNINTKTGNFNTNHLTVAYAFGKYTDQVTPGAQYTSLHHKIGFEWHKWFNYEAALIGDYGFTRLNYDFSYRIYQTYNAKKSGFKKVNSINKLTKNSIEKEKWRFNGQISYAVNKYANQAFFKSKRLVKSKSKQNGEHHYYTEVYKTVVQSWKSVYDRFWA